MLALSLSDSPDEGRDSWDDDEMSAVVPPLTWRRWLEMLWPDTPARHQVSQDGWRMKSGPDDTLGFP